VRACADAVFGASCEAVAAPLSACERRGTLADGAPCSEGFQCASGACLGGTDGCGRCVPRVSEGADCSEARCAYPLVCGSTKRCVSSGGQGASCGGTEDCQSFYRCINGHCQRLLPLHAACTTDANPKQCDINLRCTPLSERGHDGECRPFVLGKDGDPCGVVGKNPSTVVECANGDCINARCVRHLTDGAPCGPATPNCEALASCREGTCSLVDPAACH
jgi:hypothetical protein